MRDALDAVLPRWEGLAVAGRTDTGVHATGQVASLRGEGGPPLERIGGRSERRAARRRRRGRGNAAPGRLPRPLLRDGRAYRYVVLNRPRPSRSRGAQVALVAPCRSTRAAADVGRVARRRARLPAFTPTETQHEVFMRDVRAAAWERRGDQLHFTITADSFLRHMVRTLVGTMLERTPRRSRRSSRAAASGGRHDGPAVRVSTSSASTTGRGYDRRRCATGRPLRPRRHADRLGADHPRLDEARVAHRARPGARRGARARRDRRPRPRSRRCATSTPTASTSSSRSTARTTSRSTRASSRSSACSTCSRSARRGPAARDRHRQAAADRRLAFDRFPVLRERCDVVVGAEDTERHKPDPDPLLEALAAARRADSGDAAYVGDSPFDIRAAKAAGVSRSPSAGAASTPTSACSPRSPTRSSTPRRSCMPSSDAAARDRGAPPAGRAPHLPLPRPRRPGAPRHARTTASTTSCGARGRASRARRAGLADPARRRAARCGLHEGRRTFTRWARSRR